MLGEINTNNKYLSHANHLEVSNSPDPTSQTLWSEFEIAWKKLQTDILIDPSDSGKRESDGETVYNLMRKLTPDEIQQFNTAASSLISEFGTCGDSEMVNSDQLFFYTQSWVGFLHLEKLDYKNLSNYLSSAVYNDSGKKPVDLFSLVSLVLDKMNAKVNYAKFINDWSKIVKDIAKNTDRSLDSLIQTEVRNLLSFFESMDNEGGRAAFSSGAEKLFTKFTTADSKSHSPDDLFSIIHNGLNLLLTSKTAGNTYSDIYNNIVNPSITDGTFVSTGVTAPINFNDMLNEVVQVIVYS